MGIISKLNYIKATKEMIRTSLNKFGANLTTSSTFRSYATFLDTLYNKYPKGSASGTNLSISNTKYGKIALTLNGNIIQDSGTPSLTSPKALHIPKGENTIIICGKNLFDKDHANIIDNATFSSGMVAYNATQKVLYIPCEPSTTYTISKVATSGLNARFAVATAEAIDPESYYDTDIYNTSSSDTASSITYTTDSSAVYLMVLFYNSNNTQYTLQETLDSIQIEYGSSATTYEGYKGQEFPLNLRTTEIRGIGNIKDYILKNNGNWYYKQKIIKQTPTSSYNFVKNNTQPIEGVTLFYYDNYYADNDGDNNSNTVYAMSSMFKGIGYKDMMSDDVSTQYAISLQCDTDDNRRVWLRVPSSVANDVATLKSLMDTYSPVVYLATKPAFYQDIRISNTTTVAQLEAISKAMSVEGMTNIIQVNSNGPFVIGASYLEGDE